MKAHFDLSPDFTSWNERLNAFTECCDPIENAFDMPTGDLAGLNGLTVGVKDIIDVIGLPTRNGSDTCHNASPAGQDAAAVAALRNAGAAIVGKTATTEFAFTDPTNCRNPYDLKRSPGGSSSGSGSSVAARMVDLALGTQTAGSLIRPAAYCGAVGLKPTTGWISTKGVTPLAPSFDAVGVIARDAEVAEAAFGVMQAKHWQKIAKMTEECVFTTVLLDATTQAAPETLEAYRAASTTMSGLCRETAAPMIDLDIEGIVADHRILMNYEAAQAHGHLLANAALLKPKFRAALEVGAAIATAEAEAAKERLAQARETFWLSMKAVDVMLTMPVPDGAPLIDGTTGFQDWLTPWTVFGGPLVSLPWGLDSLGRPRAVMLAGHPGCEATLLCVARALEAKAPILPAPTLPTSGSDA